jgi:uncharacterized protein (TIGR02452 family)
MVYTVQPILDSEDHAHRMRSDLHLPRELASHLGRSALAAIREGCYQASTGELVDWRADVAAAVAAKVSLSPSATLPSRTAPLFEATQVLVTNESTLAAAHDLVARQRRVLALNFADGIHPGGGFLTGGRAQEEALCRSSALYATLEGDPMYAAHAARPTPDSSDWVILSPAVPVFRSAGENLREPWLLSFASCAAPFAPRVGQPRSRALLKGRIERLLAVASAYGFDALVLGAWGCGAFGNDPQRTAEDFVEALRERFAGHYAEVVFAIADWSPERRFLQPFGDALRTLASVPS